jgi:uncharacterized low-complexity protein
MSEKKVAKPVALAVGAALAGTFALGASANAEVGASPFAMTSLASGYMLGLGEGSCGGDKEGEKGEKEGEGSCGGDKKDKEGEGACGEGSCGEDKEGEGACGEGSCGGDAEDEKEGGEGA